MHEKKKKKEHKFKALEKKCRSHVVVLCLYYLFKMSGSISCDSSNFLEEKCLHLANKLIVHCKVSHSRIQCIKNIDSDLIVLLFESITNHTIPDLVFNTSKEEEAHNVQAVIDTLSLDLLGISLSHITGEDVVSGNLVAIYNLLEVLEGIAVHLKIRKDTTANKKGYLKRKTKERKKSISRQKSRSPNHATNSLSTTAKSERVQEASESTSGSFTLTTDSKFSMSSSKSASTKPTYVSVKSQFTQEKNLSSEYPASGSTVSHSAPSKVTVGQSSQALFQTSHPGKETDLATHRKKEVQKHDNQLSSKSENRPHFQIEKVDQDRHLLVGKEMHSVPIHLKGKISTLSCGKKCHQPTKKEEEVEDLFEKNLEKKVRVLLEKNTVCYPRSSRLKRLQLQSLQKPVRKTSFAPCKKSFLLPHSLRHRGVRKTSLKKPSGPKTHISRICKEQKVLVNEKPHGNPKSGFIQELFDEFPGLQLPPEVVNHIRTKYQQHLLKLHKQVKSVLSKKPKAQLQAEEASKRQAVLSELLKKNILEEQFLRESRENRKYENKIKYRLRDARLQSAKMKQYYDEFHTEMRKKMQKRNFAEEMILEKVFLDALDMQKEQVNYLCQEVKDAEEKDAKQHLAYLDALENLYQTQFAMLSETISTEKKDKQEQIKAQEQLMRSMQKDFQEELIKEIRFMQKVILECTEDTHFREMDAELYNERLKRRYL